MIWCFISSSFVCPIQGRLPLTGTTVTRHAEDADNAHYAFDITGVHLKLWRKLWLVFFSLVEDTAVMRDNEL